MRPHLQARSAPPSPSRTAAVLPLAQKRQKLKINGMDFFFERKKENCPFKLKKERKTFLLAMRCYFERVLLNGRSVAVAELGASHYGCAASNVTAD